MDEIWDRLAEVAGRTARPLEEVIRHHLLEGVLRRVSQLPHSEDFVLRGGMLARMWLAPLPRPSRDLDFVGTFPWSVEETRERFRAALLPEFDDGVIIAERSLHARGIWTSTPFPGVRLFLRLGLGQPDQSLTIDVGFNDPLVPPAMRIPYPILVSETAPLLWCVHPATAIAWKLHGLHEKGEHGWRPKDLDDLMLLLERMPVPEAELLSAIEAAFVSRGDRFADAPRVFSDSERWRTARAEDRWEQHRHSIPGRAIPEPLHRIVVRTTHLLSPLLNRFDVRLDEGNYEQS